MAQTRTARRSWLDTESLTTVHWAAIVLAAITGIDHLYLFVDEGFLPFLLAGLGFFGAIALLLIGFYRRWLYLLGIPYTAAQIVLWYLQGTPNFAFGVFDKIVQVLLIVLFGYLFLADRP